MGSNRKISIHANEKRPLTSKNFKDFKMINGYLLYLTTPIIVFLNGLVVNLICEFIKKHMKLFQTLSSFAVSLKLMMSVCLKF